MKHSELHRCQVETPHDVVRLVWQFAQCARKGVKFGSALDLGAGDGRFGRVANVCDRYVGVEIDKSKATNLTMKHTKIVVGDAMDWQISDYELCIGNPPFIRHHGLDAGWHDKVLEKIQADGGQSLNATANAFVLFLAQALLRTRKDGLVVQVVPYEWVTRPSAAELRDFIRRNRWNVTVYRFDVDVFPSVLTTASITIIDKAARDGKWTFGRVGRDGETQETQQPSGSRHKVLPYANGRAGLCAIRGLSPGGQDLFVLTEEQRLYYGLRKRSDVVPCVTSLRSVDPSISTLSVSEFDKSFVSAGRPCWLIRSHTKRVSSRLQEYLDAVGTGWKKYSTCTLRSPWWRYRPHPVPELLFSSGFTQRKPKVLVNSAGVIAVGAVYGILSDGSVANSRRIANKLANYDFKSRVVSHANDLKKLEVRQLNAVLNQLFA